MPRPLIVLLTLLVLWPSAAGGAPATPRWGTGYFGQMVTLAGGGTAGVAITYASGVGYLGTGSFIGEGTDARLAFLNLPSGTAQDASGNIYVADTANCRLRKISSAQIITTLVNDPGNTRGLCNRIGIAVDSANVYFPDSLHNVVRAVPSGGGAVTVAAGTPGIFVPNNANSFESPSDVKLDANNHLYVLDGGHQVKAPGQGIYGAAANGGPTQDGIAANLANLGSIGGLAVLGATGDVYISDSSCRVRLIPHNTGFVTTIAGNGTCGPHTGDGGPAAAATLASPGAIAVDLGRNVFIAEATFNGGGTENIRRLDWTTKFIYTVVGAPVGRFGGEGGPALAEPIFSPDGLTVDGSGNLYFSDRGNNRVRFVNFSSPPATAANFWGSQPAGINTLAGGGFTSGYSPDGSPAWGASLSDSAPQGIAVNAANGDVFFSDPKGLVVRRISGTAVGTGGSTVRAGTITTVLGTGQSGASASGGAPTATKLMNPNGVAVDAAGNLFVADSGANVVWRVSANGAAATIVAGGGVSTLEGVPATAARLNVSGIELDASGNLYVAESQRIRKVAVNTQTISTVAGGGAGSLVDGGSATAGSFSGASNVRVDLAGNIYIPDGVRIWKVTAGVLHFFAGTGTAGYSGDNGAATAAAIYIPSAGLALDPAGNLFFLNAPIPPTLSAIRKVNLAGNITTVAGPAANLVNILIPYGDGGLATAAILGDLKGIATDPSGSVLFGSQGNGARIRIVSSTVVISGTVTTAAAATLPGVTMTLTTAGTSTASTVLTDSSGNYQFAVPLGGTYTVAPSLSRGTGLVPYVFVPNVPYTFINPTTNQSDTNFSLGAVQPRIGAATYSIGGQVTAGGNPVAGVTAALNDGSITTTTLTDDSGSYLFPVLPVGGNYTAALSYSPGPGFPAYEFSPASFIVNNHQADQTALNSVASVMAGVPALGITGTHTGIFSQGQSGALYSLTVSNGSSGVTTSGTVTVTETAPAGLKVVSLSGAGWACGSSSCTRADSLDPGASYPPITAAVNVALNSAASLTNQASVSGGGSDPASVSDPTAVRTFSPCDVNQDSTTTVADVQKMIDEALGVAPGASDLNHDGVVNVVDVQLVINAALGLGCSG